MTQQIGDGYFIDDSDEYDSDESDKKGTGADEDGDDIQRRSRITSRQRFDSEAGSSSLADEESEMDHLNFIEQMLMKNNSRAQEIKHQIEKEEEE